MLVALDRSGARTAAAPGLDRRAGYRCPLCAQAVIVKAGRQRVAHFAHAADTACAAHGESARHLAAKRLLAEELAVQGHQVAVEAVLGPARRADLLVRTPAGTRFTVEVQDSPIAVDEMKARERLDRRAGCVATAWVFTGSRVPDALFAPPPWPAVRHEVRLADELRWRWHATHQPVACLRDGRLHGLELSSVVRAGRDRRRLRTTVAVSVLPLSFRPRLAVSRYGTKVVSFARPG